MGENNQQETSPELKGNKVLLTTGSSSGIGAELVKIAAQNQYNVIVNYNSNAAGAEQVASACREFGVEAITVKADVGSNDDCKKLVATAMDQWGRIDALVNNAGTTKIVSHGDLHGLDAKDFQDIYQINTIGAFQMIRAAAPALKVSRGSIVNVASVAGLLGVGTSLAYACSKAAMLAMNKSMARELGPEIRVNAVCPGFVEGDWLRNGLGDEIFELVKTHYQNQARTQEVMTPRTVAENIWYFVALAKNITGEHLLMDGGASLPY